MNHAARSWVRSFSLNGGIALHDSEDLPCSDDFLAAPEVFISRLVTVITPTPPGTGLMALHLELPDHSPHRR